MEFYDLVGLKLGFNKKEFQFPTGWNSTLHILLRQGSLLCFNSQRDGILLSSYFIYIVIFWFQFPTGWNSTVRKYQAELRAICFNSQRDGILQEPFLKLRNFRIVSIPNGMEFYLIE